MACPKQVLLAYQDFWSEKKKKKHHTKLTWKMKGKKAVTLEKTPSRHLKRFMNLTMMLWEV